MIKAHCSETLVVEFVDFLKMPLSEYSWELGAIIQRFKKDSAYDFK